MSSSPYYNGCANEDIFTFFRGVPGPSFGTSASLSSGSFYVLNFDNYLVCFIPGPSLGSNSSLISELSPPPLLLNYDDFFLANGVPGPNLGLSASCNKGLISADLSTPSSYNY